MRVFLGTSDTASCLSGLALGLRALGVSVTTVVRDPDPYSPDRHYDIVRRSPLQRWLQYDGLPRLVSSGGRKVGESLAAVREILAVPEYLDHDVFVFIHRPWWHETVTFPLLKRLDKKVVSYWLGSEARHISAFEQQFGVDTSSWPSDLNQDPLEAKIRKIRCAELNADLIYSVPDQSGLAVRPYYHARIPFASMDDVAEHIPGRAVPVVLHAPSRPTVKGTADIVRAVESLRARGIDMKFELLQGIPRRDLLRRLEDADIVIDELILEGPGVLSAEAMAAGCAVCTHTSASLAANHELPFAPVDRSNVESVIERLVVDLDWRRKLASSGRRWVAETYGATVVAKRLLLHLAGGEPPEYVPDFFVDRYQLPGDMRLHKSTRRLSDEVIRRFRQDIGASRVARARKRGLVA